MRLSHLSWLLSETPRSSSGPRTLEEWNVRDWWEVTVPAGRVRPFLLCTPVLARGPAQAGPCRSRPKEDDSVRVAVRLRQAAQKACLCCGGVSGRSQPPLCQPPVWSSCLLGLLLGVGGRSAFVPKEVMRGFPRFTPSAVVHQKETGQPAVTCSQGPLWLPHSPLFSEHMQVTD